MKWLMLFFISLPSMAKECALYELQGDVSMKELKVTITANRDSNSQREFIFDRKIAMEMGPYLNKTVRGQFVINRLEILKIEEVKLAVPDPLYRSQEMVKMKSVPCGK